MASPHRISTCTCWAWAAKATSTRSSPTTPAVRETARLVVGVADSPKPPPRPNHVDAARGSAVAGGLAGGGRRDKADAVAAAIGGADPEDVPAAGANGRDATVWLLDETPPGSSRRPVRRPLGVADCVVVGLAGRSCGIRRPRVAIHCLHCMEVRRQLGPYGSPSGHTQAHGRQGWQQGATERQRLKTSQAALNADVTVDQVDSVLAGLERDPEGSQQSSPDGLETSTPPWNGSTTRSAGSTTHRG